MSDAGKPKNRSIRGVGALFIPACLFLGTGTGWAFHHLVSGVFVGLGAGLLVFAIVMMVVHE